jgi:hypothetical protein
VPTRPAQPDDTSDAPSGQAAERRRIVASKLTGPPLRPGIVDCPTLLDVLVSATHAPVVLVSAPAGYVDAEQGRRPRSLTVRPR